MSIEKKSSLKNNLYFRVIVIAIALFLDFGLRFIPAPTNMSQDAMGVIGVFAGSLLLWLTLSIDWPSILCIFALALLPNFGVKTALTSSFGSETFIFLVFTFACTYALSKTPLIKRVALWFVSNKIARKNGWLFTIMFFISITFLGLFMSPTVLFVVMMPILEQILQIANIKKGDKAGKMLYIGMAFCVSISSGMTPIAHVFPILAMNAAGLTINYFSYMAFAIPVGLLCVALMILIFRFVLRPDLTNLKGLDVSNLKEELPKIELREILISTIFALVVFLWISPSICTSEKIINIVLFSIAFLLILIANIKIILGGAKNKNILKFTIGLITFTLFSALLLTGFIFIWLNKYNFIIQLSISGIGFLIIMCSLAVFINMFAVINSVDRKEKKKTIVYSILLGLVAILLACLIIFSNSFLTAINFVKSCGTAMPPILGTILLCLIRVNGEQLVNIQDAFKNGIPWSSLMMCAGTLTLGAALTNNNIGLKTYLQTNLTNALSGTSAILLLIIFVVWALIQTNMSSNMVTATLVSTVANSILLSINSSLCLPAVICIIGMLSAFAFATPPSMPHIAITASSGYASTKDVLKYGLLMMLISLIISLVIGYPLASILM